ncbi:MAG: hypothetical protein GY940_34920, partial [bacterium]|nr:hypothetical protein [bacterium]
EVKALAVKALDHQDYPFESLVGKTTSQRDTTRNPLFDAAFVLQNLAEKKGAITDMVVPGDSKPYQFEINRAKFALTLIAVETEEALKFSLEYNPRLFKYETAVRFTGYIKNIASFISRGTDSEIARIDVVSKEERKQLLTQFNATRGKYPRDKSIHRLFREQMERSPDAAAVKGTARVYLTYRHLNDKADRLARFLRGRGVEKGSIGGV